MARGLYIMFLMQLQNSTAALTPWGLFANPSGLYIKRSAIVCTVCVCVCVFVCVCVCVCVCVVCAQNMHAYS